MQSAQGDYDDAKFSIPLSTNLVARNLSDASNLHTESRIDSLTFRFKFMVYNSMAAKKFRGPFVITLFLELANLSFYPPCSPTSPWCRSREYKFHPWWRPFARSHRCCLMLSNQCYILFAASFAQKSALPAPSQLKHSLFPNFCQNPVNGQLPRTKWFCYHFNSHLAVIEYKKLHTIDVFMFAPGGVVSWFLVLSVCWSPSQPTLKMGWIITARIKFCVVIQQSGSY